MQRAQWRSSRSSSRCSRTAGPAGPRPLAASLAERVAVPSAPAAQAPPVAESDTAAFVITQVGTPREDDAPPAGPVPVARPIDGRLFTDIVARETVVKAAGWTHGLRRALSPETRNRIRFEVRQETRRAGREPPRRDEAGTARVPGP